MSDVTGCRKTRVSDCTGSTVVVYVTSMYPNCHLKYKPDFTLCILCRPLIGFIASNTLNYLAFQSFDFEHTWWRLFQKRVVRTKLDINVFIFFRSNMSLIRERCFNVSGHKFTTLFLRFHFLLLFDSNTINLGWSPF